MKRGILLLCMMWIAAAAQADELDFGPSSKFLSDCPRLTSNPMFQDEQTAAYLVHVTFLDHGIVKGEQTYGMNATVGVQSRKTIQNTTNYVAEIRRAPGVPDSLIPKISKSGLALYVCAKQYDPSSGSLETNVELIEDALTGWNENTLGTTTLREPAVTTFAKVQQIVTLRVGDPPVPLNTGNPNYQATIVLAAPVETIKRVLPLPN